MSDRVAVSSETSHHLDRVLRYAHGDLVTYTDGTGTIGEGIWNGAEVERDSEQLVAASMPSVTMAVAPPKARERQRFIVEKLQELGTHALIWIRTDRTEGRPPPPAKAATWAIGAMEQSRGAFLMQITSGTIGQLSDAIVADAEGHPLHRLVPFGDQVAVIIGPEGGLTSAERSGHAKVSIGPRTLRTETAAVSIMAGITALADC